MDLHDNILELANNFDVFLFDAYGVFWDGSKFYANSKEHMQQLVEQGKTVFVVSNTTQVKDDAIASYTKKGLELGTHYNELITSGEVARQLLLDKQLHFQYKASPKKVYVFGAPNAKLFADTIYEVVDNLELADFIYISVPQFTEEEVKHIDNAYQGSLRESKLPKEGQPRRWDSLVIEPFLPALKEFKTHNLPMFNANPDLTAREGVKDKDEANFVIRQGAIAQAYRDLGGEVVEMGKPHKAIYDAVFAVLAKTGVKVDPARTAMIGDTIRTDIKGGNNAGVKTILCVETGVTADILNALDPSQRADKLTQLCQAERATIDYLIKGV